MNINENVTFEELDKIAKNSNSPIILYDISINGSRKNGRSDVIANAKQNIEKAIVAFPGINTELVNNRFILDLAISNKKIDSISLSMVLRLIFEPKKFLMQLTK